MSNETLRILGPPNLSKSDVELGKWLVASWLGYQAEKAGISPSSIPDEWAASLIEASAEMDSDSVENAALESAFRKGCSGDFEAAGRMLRAYLWGGAESMANEQMAKVGRAHRVGNLKGGRKAGERRQAEAAAWHQECVEAARKLLEAGRSPRELAGILAPRFHVTSAQVRNVLKKAKLK